MIGAGDTCTVVDVGLAGVPAKSSFAVALERVDLISAGPPIFAKRTRTVVDVGLAGLAVVPSFAVARKLVDAIDARTVL